MFAGSPLETSEHRGELGLHEPFDSIDDVLCAPRRAVSDFLDVGDCVVGPVEPQLLGVVILGGPVLTDATSSEPGESLLVAVSHKLAPLPARFNVVEARDDRRVGHHLGQVLVERVRRCCRHRDHDTEPVPSEGRLMPDCPAASIG